MIKKLGTILAGIALVLIAAPASAHYVKDNPILYQSYEQCVGSWSEISHGTGKGYAKAETHSTDQHLYGVCARNKVLGPNMMIVHPQVWQDNGSVDWKCSDWGQIKNGNTTHTLTFTRTFPAVPTGGLCDGTLDWYGTYSGHFILWQGGWRGGWAFSGWHKLPTTPGNEPVEGIDPDEKPALDSWVDPVTMIVDLSLVPDDRFPVPS